MEQLTDLKAILHSKRANVYYLEKCRVMQKGGRAPYLTEAESVGGTLQTLIYLILKYFLRLSFPHVRGGVSIEVADYMAKVNAGVGATVMRVLAVLDAL